MHEGPPPQLTTRLDLDHEAAPAFRVRVRRVARAALDLVLPHRCLGCGDDAQPPGGLCLACWSAVRFVTAPCCQRCGLPLPDRVVPPGIALVCADCTAKPPAFDAARAAFVYDDGSRGVVLAFKHAGRLDAAPALAAMLHRAAAPLLAECDWIAPVPLHWTRLLRRGYNQAAELARALGQRCGLPVRADLLQRVRRTPLLGGLDRQRRRAVVAGAFGVTGRHRTALAGRRILLVDDVMTTGATVAACARCLRRAEAARVSVVTLARAVRDG